MPDPSSGNKSPDEVGCVFPTGVTPSLDWLIHPVSKELFFGNYWEKQTFVVTRNRPDYFSPLLSFDEVDRALTTLDRRYPDVTLKNARREITSDDYVIDGDRLDITRVYQLFGEGATITLAFLDNVIPALALFCRS